MAERRIGQRLVAAGLISEDELDHALRAQVVHGGRIGTNLVESVELDLDDLAMHLADQRDCEPALAHDFARANATVQATLPPELAARWMCVPLGFSEAPESGSQGAVRVVVASCDRLGPEVLAELEILFGVAVDLAIAPELRIYFHLEAVYGFERPNRFKRVRGDPSVELPIFFEDDDELGEEDDHHSDELGSTELGSIRDELGLEDPSTRSESRRLAERRHFVRPLSDIDEDGEPSREVLARIPIRRARRASGSLALGEVAPEEQLAEIDGAVKAIKRATGRDRVGDLVVRSLREGFGGGFDVGMILVVRDGLAVGWKGFVRGGLDRMVELIAIPLSEPSSVGEAHELASTYMGPPMQHSAIEERLWDVLEVGAPRQVAVVPVELFGELVCMMYAHAERADGIPPSCADALQQLAAAVSSAFERLTRAAQR